MTTVWISSTIIIGNGIFLIPLLQLHTLVGIATVKRFHLAFLYVCSYLYHYGFLFLSVSGNPLLPLFVLMLKYVPALVMGHFLKMISVSFWHVSIMRWVLFLLPSTKKCFGLFLYFPLIRGGNQQRPGSSNLWVRLHRGYASHTMVLSWWGLLCWHSYPPLTDCRCNDHIMNSSWVLFSLFQDSQSSWKHANRLT